MTDDGWGSDVEIERQRRINVAAWAWAYEVENDPIVDDATFDRECRLIRPEIATGHAVLDDFFRTEFSPHTGMWVHKHPEKHLLPRIASLARQGAVRKAFMALSPEQSQELMETGEVALEELPQAAQDYLRDHKANPPTPVDIATIRPQGDLFGALDAPLRNDGQNVQK